MFLRSELMSMNAHRHNYARQNSVLTLRVPYVNERAVKMTEFVGVSDMAQWIQRDSVEGIIAGMMEYIEDDYKRWERFDKIPRIATHTPIGVIELMPTSDGIEYGYKYVNGHPSNPSRGFQTVVAYGALANADNGYPTFMAEMTLLTALRTAATSALVARKLARPDSTIMAMIGSGSQSEFQALGFRAALGINTLQIYDIDPAAIEKFQRNLIPLGFDIRPAPSVDEAVLGADVITTCTADKAQNKILNSRQIAPGMHINGVGGDCPGKTEMDARILGRSKVFVEFEAQSRVEGEIQQMPTDFPVTEIWKLLRDEIPGRTSDEDITLFDSVGFAINDFSALRYCRDQLTGSDLQIPIDLIAEPENPKDLFSLTAAFDRV